MISLSTRDRNSREDILIESYFPGSWRSQTRDLDMKATIFAHGKRPRGIEEIHIEIALPVAMNGV